ncbi:unnamed protein product [Lactuca virosa]|uniref:Kinesin-like protein n=1 Tax=Lactuca virosa TaxID=75947 RepID=A0AAU9NN97_9ASTR|nr:unnamed protein product [Lactuca virosa]
MNALGRHGQRSGSSAAAQHQRQYTDNFVDVSSSSNGQWLQSAGLQHLQQQSSNTSSSMDFGYYNGNGAQDSRMYNNSRNISTQMSVTGGTNLFTEPFSPPARHKKLGGGGGDDPSDFSPGLLDLHSHDTELISEVPMSGASLYADPYYENSKQNSKKDKGSTVAKIKVVVRKRPLNKKELAKNEEDIVTTESHSNCLAVHETKLKVDLTEYLEKHEFVFDAVLNEEVSNDEVYHETVEPIVPIIFQRTKATCFAYGQTGSGKTFTMKPLPLKASRDILRLMYHTYRGQGFQLHFSFFEIYGGKLFDLLNDRKKLCMREDGSKQVCIVGLQEYRVSDVETIKELIDRGNSTRSTGTTGANEESSRSHAILQLCVKRSVDGSELKPAKVVGKLSFIDLAGSERGADTTDNDKQTRMEGAEINKSLLALKECIRALDNDQGHIPFRGSKLTEVLRDSFVGNSRTVMVSCISPNAGSCEHTLNTLRYADRVKSLSKGNKKDTINLKESTIQPEEDDYDVDTTEEFYEPKLESRNWNPDDDLNALLKEEEDLVDAHRKQVEDTMNIVRVEMNLLVEADKPGNQLDDYVAKLNTVLAQKAEAILQLQNRLAHFQKRLRDHNVLVSSSGL